MWMLLFGVAMEEWRVPMPEPLWDYFSGPERTAFVLLFISNQLLNYLFLFINDTEVTLFSVLI